MSRVEQPAGRRGSLKWLQKFINERPDLLASLILPGIGAKAIYWRSPLAADNFAEYRDSAFLSLLGLSHLASQLDSFWPKRGPQWDALGLSDNNDVLLVEAKAHVPELYSPPSAAGEASAKKIQVALDEAAMAFGVPPQIRWGSQFYQLANRLAHLHFLRKNDIRAWLVLINFVGDDDMRGPDQASHWEREYTGAYRSLGLQTDGSLMTKIIHVYPDVRAF
jgi:hypothetical protein